MGTSGLIEYTDKNLGQVRSLIISHLTPDLLPKKYRERNAHNKYYGHCHTASVALQTIFGRDNITLYRAKDDEGLWHWWCVDKDGYVLDITASQYYWEGRMPPYADGKKASALGFEYKKRAAQVVDSVMEVWNREHADD